MTSNPSGRRYKRGAPIAAMLALGLALLISAPASNAATQQNGRALLRSAENGRSCSQFGIGDFERMGEVVMGRMAGSPAVHDAMEAQMRRMMGPGAERRVHLVLGHRFSGCSGGGLPARFGPMMRTVGMGMMIGSGNTGSFGGQSSMMGGYGRGHHDGDGIGAGWVLLLVALAAALALGAGLSIGRSRRSDRASEATKH